MNLLVTGGAGFIGSNFIKLVFSFHPDWKITNLDKLTYAGRLENLKELEKNKNYKFIKGDICDRTAVKKAMKDCDAVINFAAESFVDKAIASPEQFISTNIFGTFNLLEEARINEVQKFIQISSDEIYGSTEKGSFNEFSPLNPRNPYSASKASADLLAFSYFITYSLPVLVTRSSNNFGPNQFPEKFIPLFITNLLREKKVPLYGDGKNIRDWLHVKDNCRAIELLLRKGRNGEIYNIGAENEKQNIEVVEMILSKLRKNNSFIEFVKDRPGHDRRYSLNWNKIKELGWKPEKDFNENLDDTIEWYKKNEWWWYPLVR